MTWLMLTCMFAGGAQQPAFIVVNEANAANHKMVADDAVIAFAQTTQGRVLFSRFGAFVGVPNGDENMAVLQVGFSSHRHKQGLSPRFGKMQPTRIHRFGGAQASWQKNLRVPKDLTYRQVWPGADLQFLTRGSDLEFQVHLSPGADPFDVVLTTGAETLQLADGNLIASLDQAQLELSAPIAFQMIDGERHDVPVAYRILQNGEFGFTLGNYDSSMPLIIDPVLSWSTLFGAGGAASETERAVVVTLNDANEAIFAGETTTPDFPVTPGALFEQYKGNRDLFVGKLSADGSTLEFLTFFGSDGDDRVYDIILDDSDNILLTGEVRGDNFPITPGAYDVTRSGDDGFVTKLNATGSAVIWSTFLGGSGSDEGRVLLLGPGGIVMALAEGTSSDFDTTPGAADTTSNGFQDVYIAGLSADGTQLLYGSLFGGSDSDNVSGAVLLADGRLMFTGESESNDLPTTTGAFSEIYNNGDDIYVAILAADGSGFTHVTYLGGSDDDLPVGLATDGSGNVFVGGYTSSSDFNVTMGAFDESFNGDRDGFVVKLSADLSLLLAGTYLGTVDRDFIRAFAIDGSGQPIAIGTAGDGTWPTTPGAFDTTLEGNEIFVTKLNADLTALVFSTFLGGSSGESPGSGVALDAMDNLYIPGSVFSQDFPTTSSMRSGSVDAFILKLAADGSNFTYSNIFGGGGDDEPYDALRLSTGETLIVGNAGAADFPITAGVFDTTILNNEAFISKFDATGSTLLFSTFLGGSSFDTIQRIAIASDNNLVVAGATQSADFPTTAGVFDDTYSGFEDIFVAKISANGDALIFASLFGGPSSDTLEDLALGPDDSIYLTGRTPDETFPITIGSFDDSFNGSFDAFVSKLNPTATNLEYSTFLGTTEFDNGSAIKVDAMGQAVVIGTARDGFPTTMGVFDETFNGVSDGFVTKLNASGTDLIFSTYLGGNSGESLTDLILDATGEIHVTGSASTGFPTTMDAFQPDNAGSTDAFLSTLSADGAQLLYSTFLGGSGFEFPIALQMDAAGNLFVSGTTDSTDFPTTPFAPQNQPAGLTDAFVSVLDCNGTGLSFSTYWGFEDDEQVRGFSVDAQGIAALYGETESKSFFASPGAFDTNFDGDKDLFLTTFDLRSEYQAVPAKQTEVQGLSSIILKATLPECPTDPLDVQWFNETDSIDFPINVNPIRLVPTPTETLSMRVDITNTGTHNFASRHVTVLVADNPMYFDANGDGCNDVMDLHVLAPTWRTSVADDPSGDGFVDITDFLYINTDEEGACPEFR